MKHIFAFLLFCGCALAECAIATAALPKGKVGVGYSAIITTSGCGTGLSFSTTDGSLPSGLQFESGGKISGTPTHDGWFCTKVGVKGASGSASAVYWTEIAPPTPLSAAPSIASASVTKHEIDLTWDAPVPAPSSYSVYRASSAGGPYQRVASEIRARAWKDSAAGGTIYYYVTTAVKNGMESVCSNEVKVVVP